MNSRLVGTSPRYLRRLLLHPQYDTADYFTIWSEDMPMILAYYRNVLAILAVATFCTGWSIYQSLVYPVLGQPKDWILGLSLLSLPLWLDKTTLKQHVLKVPLVVWCFGFVWVAMLWFLWILPVRGRMAGRASETVGRPVGAVLSDDLCEPRRGPFGTMGDRVRGAVRGGDQYLRLFRADDL